MADAAREQVLGLINAAWTTQVVHACCTLGLPELLADGPADAESLARCSGSHAPSLQRLLRALASLGLCAEGEDGRFVLTDAGALLRADAPESLQAWALLTGGPQWARWGELAHSVRSGRSHRQRHGGQDDFGALGIDPAAAALFHRAMTELTRRVAAQVLSVVDLAAARCIVDVGGGSGELLAQVLQAWPAARGVLFDLPHALAGAEAVLGRAGVRERCEQVSGSFFDGVPAGDTLLLKSVLHNWDDARCGRLLARCRAALDRGARLLVIERVLPGHMAAVPQHRAVTRSDLNMLVALSGRERCLAEFDALLAASGFALQRVLPTAGEFQVLEACAA